MSQFPDEQSDDGEFTRQEDRFREWVRAEPAARFPAEAGRYHLYVSLACPWAHRTVVMRRLKGLEEIIGMTVVDPLRDARGWRFGEGPGFSTDPVNGWKFLSEAYEASAPGYDQRVTVPVLWDTREGVIVSNNEDDLMRMFNSEFDALISDPEARARDFRPEELCSEMDRLADVIYETVNDGVYKAGFATKQETYEKNVSALFATLDVLETRLGGARFLMGGKITEVDWKLFMTLVRFDPVYHGHFKCNLRRIADYPNLFEYLRDLYQYPGIAETVRFDHIKAHYYKTHDDINPTGIVPLGPDQDLHRPHDRGRFTANSNSLIHEQPHLQKD